MSAAAVGPLTGAVLVGGRSARLGRPKWREPVGGVPMAERAANALRPHATEVVLVASHLPESTFGLAVVRDEPGAGPLAGVAAALAHAAGLGARGALVLACDLPLVDAELLGALVARWSGEQLVAPLREGRLQPLCALWSVGALPTVRAALAADERAVHGVIGRLTLRVVDEVEWRACSRAADPLLNVNTPADLARAEALAAAGPARSVPGRTG